MPNSAGIGKHPKTDIPFDLAHRKPIWKKRLLAIKKDGQLPSIDIESSFNSGKVSGIAINTAMRRIMQKAWMTTELL